MSVLLLFPAWGVGGGTTGPSSLDRRSGDSDNNRDEGGRVSRDGPSSPVGGEGNDNYKDKIIQRIGVTAVMH